MNGNDVFKIVFGAFLGLAISLGQKFLAEMNDRKKVLGLISMQIDTITSTLERLESMTFSVPDQKLPQLHFLSSSEYSALPPNLRRQVYILDNALKTAEDFRLRAQEHISNQGSASFKMYAKMYRQWQSESLQIADKVARTLDKQKHITTIHS